MECRSWCKLDELKERIEKRTKRKENMITKEQTMTKEQIISDSKEFSLFSWSAQGSVNPIAIERAEGVYLYDYDGNRIIDFSSGLMSVNIGHDK